METLIQAAQETKQEAEDHLGMTDAQWAQWQAYTRGYGEQDANGVDISLLRENLKLKPWERLGKLQHVLRMFKQDEMADDMDFGRVIAALNDSGLRFVIIGGIAMRLQGSAHMTDDIDFAFARDPQSLETLVKALAAFHPRLRGVPPGLPFFWDVRTLQTSLNLTLETDAGSVDLLGEPAGVASFEDLWQAAALIDWQGVPVRVASIGDLIAMKRAANRPKDQAHLLELEALHKLQADSLG